MNYSNLPQQSSGLGQPPTAAAGLPGYPNLQAGQQPPWPATPISSPHPNAHPKLQQRTSVIGFESLATGAPTTPSYFGGTPAPNYPMQINAQNFGGQPGYPITPGGSFPIPPQAMNTSHAPQNNHVGYPPTPAGPVPVPQPNLNPHNHVGYPPNPGQFPGALPGQAAYPGYPTTSALYPPQQSISFQQPSQTAPYPLQQSVNFQQPHQTVPYPPSSGLPSAPPPDTSHWSTPLPSGGLNQFQNIPRGNATSIEPEYVATTYALETSLSNPAAFAAPIFMRFNEQSGFAGNHKDWQRHPTELDWNWNNPSFVKIPLSSSNKKKDLPNWTLIEEELIILRSSIEINNRFKMGKRIKECLKVYNQNTNGCNFENLNDPELSETLIRIVPLIVDEAVKLPMRLAKAFPVLQEGRNMTIVLSRNLICSLLANSFFATFPEPLLQRGLSYFHFLKLFDSSGSPSRNYARKEKLKCILDYFLQMSRKEVPNTLVSFQRHSVHQPEQWTNSYKNLCQVHVVTNGTIETAEGMLQVELASNSVAAGILGDGAMDDIRFAICPELLVARLFTETLGDNEALIVKGIRQFSSYSGYSDSFRYMGSYKPHMPPQVDQMGRENMEIVLLDALKFKKNDDMQYQPQNINRELHKAYAAFIPASGNTPVATGNSESGDPQLKFLIQWMAASQADRNGMSYFSGGNADLAREMQGIYDILWNPRVTVGALYNCLISYHTKRGTTWGWGQPQSLFDFVKNTFRR